MTSRPFLSRLILPFAVVILLIVGTCGVVIYQTGQRAVRVRQLQDLRQLTDRMRTILSADPTLHASRKQITDFANLLGTRLTLIDGAGRVVLDTHADPARLPNHNDRPEVRAARRGDDVEQIRHSDTLHDDAMYVAELVDRGNPDGLVVRLSYPRGQWAALNVPVWAIVGGGAGATLVSVALLALILNRQWIAPVRRLARASERIAAGDWQTHVEAAGADDLRFFSSRLNQVARHLERQMTQLRDQRADLEAVVDTLPDPILLTDAGQKILVINAPAARLLDLVPPQAVGKSLVSVLADQPILDLVEQLPAPGQPELQREIRLVRHGQRHVFQSFATRTAAGGALIVLRDITTLTNAVQMKTDFVANASHELRTPIAAIKVAFETLQDCWADDPNQTQKCVTIIAGHLQRLEEMLRDLLDLSRVERPDLKPDAQRVMTSDLFAIVRSTLGVTARQKGVDLRLIARPENAAFTSDERLLHLVLKNLVENAVKFTAAGGSVTVTVAVPDDLREVTIACQDTGIGIPPEHLDRVFERFYQVNAARTGASGRGTGLGLAIVKHAVAQLGGSVKLESQVAVGTTVTIHLPQGESQVNETPLSKL